MVEQAKFSDPNAEYTMRDLSAETIDITNPRGGVRNAEVMDVQTTMVGRNYPWILVRVYTDAGVIGTGEAYRSGGGTAIIKRVKPFLVGENPLDIDRLYEHLVQKMSGEGSVSGKVISATSGIEIALHDVAGKLLDVPAYQLVGGKYRDEMRVYCDFHTGDEVNPQICAEEGVRVVEELDYDAIKFDLDVPSGHEKDRANRHLRNPEIDHKVEIVEAITEAVGNRAGMTFDCHWSFTDGSTKRLAPELEDYDMWWLEDPVPPENHDVRKLVTQSTTTPIAVGENVYRKSGQRTLPEPQTVDITAPNLPRIGGVRETRRIVDLADMYYIPVTIHNVSSPIGATASAQVTATIPNSLTLEYHSYQLGWWKDLVEEDDLIQNGHMEIPEKPGLGLTLNLDAAETHMIGGETLFDEE